MLRKIAAWIYCVYILGCTGGDQEQKGISVQVWFSPFYSGTVYLEKISFTGEERQPIDSAVLDGAGSRLQFQLPPGEESVYQLRIKGEEPRIYFVTDVPSISIKADRPDWKKYHFQNDGINNALRSFLDQQRSLTDSVANLLRKASQQTSLQSANELLLLIKKRDMAFADTVSSPGAFLFAYNRIDFGKDYTALKQLVTQAAQRFPRHQQVQQLQEETTRLVRIFEEEYQAGDQLPELSLPDSQGRQVTIKPDPNRYVFIDLWASWCQPCLETVPLKNKMLATYPNSLQIFNVAIDSDKKSWQQFIAAENVPGVHVIDEAMWRGKAAQTWKFDSIPFNFLLSPDGKILAKAIKRDSILPLLAKYIR